MKRIDVTKERDGHELNKHWKRIMDEIDKTLRICNDNKGYPYETPKIVINIRPSSPLIRRKIINPEPYDGDVIKNKRFHSAIQDICSKYLRELINSELIDTGKYYTLIMYFSSKKSSRNPKGTPRTR